MKFSFKDKAITGMMVVVPEQERLFVDDMKLFNAPENRSRKLAMVMGYNAHRVVDGDVCASDLAEFGFHRLFESGKLTAEEIDALVYVTLCPITSCRRLRAYFMGSLDFVVTASAWTYRRDVVALSSVSCRRFSCWSSRA